MVENIPEVAQLLLLPLRLEKRQLQGAQSWAHDQLHQASQMLLILCSLVQGCQRIDVSIAAPIDDSAIPEEEPFRGMEDMARTNDSVLKIVT